MKKMRKEGFPGQRLTLLPQQVIKRLQENAITQMLHPLRIGFFPRAKGHFIERKKPMDEHILIICISGCGYVSAGGEQVRVHPSQMIYLKAGEPHTYFTDEANPWSIAWVHFHGKLVGDYTQPLKRVSGLQSISVDHIETVREQFESIYLLMSEGIDDAALLKLHTSLATLFVTLQDCRKENDRFRKSAARRVERVIQHMRENLRRMLSIEEMAQVAGWTPNHFISAFRQEMKETPANFFLHLKMSLACQLLVSDDATVASIAEELGYEDPFYFSRCFRRCYRMTPTQYRKWMM